MITAQPIIGNQLTPVLKSRAVRVLSSRPQELTSVDLQAINIITLGGTRRAPYPAFAKIRAYLGTASSRTDSFLPIEEAIRPRYIDDSYSSPHIGKKVYTELIGVGSVIDAVTPTARKVKAPVAKFSVSPGQLGNPSQSSTVVEVVSQETAIDILSYEYASRGRSADFSFRKVHRDIATLPDVLGIGGFHNNAFAASNADKPLSLIQDLVYDRDKKRCPEGYRKATEQEVEEILSRVNPKLDVRESRSKLVSGYISGLRSKGKLG